MAAFSGATANDQSPMKTPPLRALGAFVFILFLALRLAAQPAPVPPADLPARVTSLRAELARHDELYFKRAAPEITDAEYDALKSELHALERLLPTDTPDAPRADAPGDDRAGAFPTVRHLAPVLGLAKSHSEAELRKFVAKVERTLGGDDVAWIVEPKYDGLSISVTYEQGRFIRAVTRGDGREGDDVTANLLACSTLPVGLDPAAAVPARVELRGEVFMRQAEFERINTERAAAGQEPFAHPRNVAVGTLKSTDAAERAGRRLDVVLYGWGSWEPAESAPASQRELLERVAAWGLPVPEWVRGAVGFDEIWREVRTLGRARLALGFPIDGVVVKVDDVAQRTRLGETDSAPNWAVAHKFEPERVETRLRAITLQVGRTGTITPVAELEPVTLGGARVARATLHSAREIERRDYRIGDVVRVEKAGEIIPVLVGVVRERREPGTAPYRFPASCPACATALVREGEAGWRCPSRSCPDQIARRAEHFVSAEALGLRGFGPAVVGALVGQGAVREVDDFFALTLEQLQAAAGGRARQAERLQAELAGARRAELWRWVHGAGLPECGPANSRKLAARFGSLPALAQADAAALRQAGLTAAAAEVLAAELARPEVRDLLARLEARRAAP